MSEPSGESETFDARDLSPRAAVRIAWPWQLLLYMLGDLAIGRLELILPDGARRRLEGREPGPEGTLRVHSARLMPRLLLGGEVGFGEAYMDGRWDSPDLCALLQVLYLNEARVRGPYERNRVGRWLGRLGHWLRTNTPRGALSNIEHHYDLGNAFYARWLDPGMTYSSAVFATPEQTLAEAQRHKYELMLGRLRLERGQHLLEIGSGWGGFAIHAARRSGCRVTGITLSREQLCESQRRAAAAGVADRVEFRLQDYRELRGRFDRVVSIEMYEAVGERWWPAYFEAIARALKPGGIAALQGIAIHPRLYEQYRRKRDFIQKHIFPGGMLATPELLREHASRAGLAAEAPAFYAEHYARTLRLWHQAVLKAQREIVQAYGERFLRMWRYYLAYCECGFRVGSIDLMQLTLRKPG